MLLKPAHVRQFRQKIWRYYSRNRRTFAWRERPTPYNVVVSEIMLQQTQAQRVQKKFSAFVDRFPDWQSLASARQRDVLSAWQGLGYNRRALSLKKIAATIMTEYGGRLPSTITVEQLEALPGIGPATARAVATFAFNRAYPFIETNIRTVYLHEFFSRRRLVPDAALMPIIEQTLVRSRPREWYYALMDYGVMLKACNVNPSRRSSHYTKQTPFKGSRRQVRGAVIRLLTRKALTPVELAASLGVSRGLVQEITVELMREGFIRQRNYKKRTVVTLA